MKLYGDVSEHDKKVAQGLEDMEAILSSEESLPKDVAAKMCVCMAHDWYHLGSDEEGHRLLQKAETFYPGYFKNLMLKHTVEDPRFDFLVKRLSAELATMILYRLKENK